ncbi:MAG TPA: MarC family protein [Myxococcaceae bacterium]|nr:MarC family protein [Myxococcaceae bacterium]
MSRSASRRSRRARVRTLLWSDLGHLVGGILLVVGALLPVVNPLGCAPLFLQMTQGLDPATRSSLAGRVAMNSFALLLGSMLLGSFVLRLFGLSLPVVQVAGGAVVCALGWRLLNRDDGSKPTGASTALRTPTDILDRAFYPLTLPLTVDPGSISVAITVGANHAHGITGAGVKLAAAVIGVGLIALSILLTYRYAWSLGRRLGHRFMVVVVRLSAFIVLCIGVQILWNGTKALAEELGIPERAPAGRSAGTTPPSVRYCGSSVRGAPAQFSPREQLLP